jgi:arylsulfatase A-like enzyme
MPTPPNVVYLHSHDTGRCVQPYGHAVPTPRIQRLAEEGILFRQAFCAAPTCSGSRAAFATGQYPHVNGMMGLAHRGFAIRDMGHHLIHTLRRAGYTSTLVGEQHIAGDPSRIGFDHVRSPAELHHAVSVAPAAAEVLLDGPRSPFFLSVGFFETHRGYFEPPSPTLANWCPPSDGLPDTADTRRDMAGFQTSAAALDRGIGIVLDALDEAHFAENTLVICTTDHGLANPGAKGTLSDRGIGVMLILRGPGGFRGGRVVDALVQHLDVYPTLCELAGIEAPPWLHGRSLLPIVRGEVDEIRDELFAELTYHAAYDPQRAVRTRRHKYVRLYGERAEPVLANVDDSPSKDVLLGAGWGAVPRASEQLYDLALDPSETCNLAAEPEHAAVLDDLRARLDRWMRATDDPLLEGPVPAPSGAILNTPDQRSPSDPTVTVA